MIATLYKPGVAPQSLSPEGFMLPNEKGYAQVDEHVSEALGCELEFVDILDSGPDYVAYAIFDCRDELNPEALQALKAISRYEFNDQEDSQLRGALLLVQR